MPKYSRPTLGPRQAFRMKWVRRKKRRGPLKSTTCKIVQRKLREAWPEAEKAMTHSRAHKTKTEAFRKKILLTVMSVKDPFNRSMWLHLGDFLNELKDEFLRNWTTSSFPYCIWERFSKRTSELAFKSSLKTTLPLRQEIFHVYVEYFVSST